MCRTCGDRQQIRGDVVAGNNRIIEVENLEKSYGDVHAVKGISFYVEDGKLFAFLGPNGAGKSTTIDMLCTVLKPDSGSVIIDGSILGKDDDAIRKSIGVVFQYGVLDDVLTVKENLLIRASLYGLRSKEVKNAVDSACQLASVTDIADRPYGKLSGGQRRRCDIARALIHMPKILFLDEPTTGLDPQTRKRMWELIIHMKEELGTTIFLTTHYMEEAAEADYVIVIDDGQIVAKGTPLELKEKYASDKLILVSSDIHKVADLLRTMGLEYDLNGDYLIVPLRTSLDALPLLELLKDYLISFEVVLGTMDEAFIAITGKELRE